jgi:hypothetical protein
VNIETAEDLKRALEEMGYSSLATTEIMKWYIAEDNPLEKVQPRGQ